MKILHIVPSYYPAFEFGGPIESVYQLNKWLVKKGAEVTVYTTNAGLQSKNVTLKKETDLDGVKVFYFPCYGYVHFTFSPALGWAIKKDIKNFDLIHITGVWNFPILTAAFWARFYKKPYIISPRGSLMKEPLEKKSSLKKKIHLFLFGKKDLEDASAIHFTTDMEKEEYLKAGLPLKKAIVIPNGLDTEEFQSNDVRHRYIGFREKYGLGKDKKIVLFLSRLNWKKGLDTLIPAFAEVIKKEPRAILVLAGSDDENYRKEIEKIISEINIRTSDVLKLKPSIFGTSDVQKIENPNIVFTGMLLGKDKAAAFQESDVFVLPSYSENFGMAVVEAMAAQLPVVITKGVGISNEVEKAGAGIVIEKSVNQLTLAILKILNNPNLAEKMGENGRKLVETEFSSEKAAERFIKEYKSFILANYPQAY
jgi:glycosyltransferase involved in cell wall biosynthesis